MLSGTLKYSSEIFNRESQENPAKRIKREGNYIDEKEETVEA